LTYAGDVYADPARPNLDQTEKGAQFYERAIRISERLVAQDSEDRQARFEMASRFGKLGDSIWRSDPKRALALYDRALALARTLVSPQQLQDLRGSYLMAICRPLVKLGRVSEARKAFNEAVQVDPSGVNAEDPYPDRLDAVTSGLNESPIMVAEGRAADARRLVERIIRDLQGLHAESPSDFSPVFYLAKAYRRLTSLVTGQERREAFLRSAVVWNSWPPTSFTRREAEKDLAAAKQ
jgi:tetratricopeptide (TPR) repeat protein